MADLECELKLEHHQQQQQQQMPQQEPSPSAVMPGSGTSFTFSRASSIGSVNAVSCSSASSTHNTGDVNNLFLSFSLKIVNINDDLRGKNARWSLNIYPLLKQKFHIKTDSEPLSNNSFTGCIPLTNNPLLKEYLPVSDLTVLYC